MCHLIFDKPEIKGILAAKYFIRNTSMYKSITAAEHVQGGISMTHLFLLLMTMRKFAITK